MACILLLSSAVRVHNLQAYRKVDVTRERISRSLELREILLSIQTGFSLVNAAVVCAILESISGLGSSSVVTTLTHPLQHNSGKDHDRSLRRTWRHCQYWRQNNHQPPLCWWHWWLSRIRTCKFSWASWQSLHSLRHRDQCREDQADDKEHQWHQHRDQSKWTETWDCHKIQVPGLSYNWWVFQIWDTLQDSTQTTAALTRLKSVWIDRIISLSSKIRLMCSLVTSMFLHACKLWTLTAELQRRIQAMEMRCYRKILRISYKDNVTNE